MLVAEFSYFLHQPWDAINDTLTMAQMTAYRRFWTLHPPVDLLAAGYLGYKAPDQPAAGGSNMDRAFEKLAEIFKVPLPPERKPDEPAT